MDDILSLLDDCHAEYFMYAPSMFHMIEYYVLKSQRHDPDTTTHMEALSGENADEYYRSMDYKIQSLMRSDTW